VKRPDLYSLSRYLAAKQSVDDRARHRPTEEQFFSQLVQTDRVQDAPLRIVELGAGLGPTARRVLRAVQKTPVEAVRYLLVDHDVRLMEQAREGLTEWGRTHEFEVRPTASGLRLHKPALQAALIFRKADALETLNQEPSESANAVIAQSFLDLVNPTTALKRTVRVLKAKGLLYFPLHFDGVTDFLPPRGDERTSAILQRYHRSMHRETPYGPSGGPHTGRKLLQLLAEQASILSAGASDWIIHPAKQGRYLDDDAYFLYHMLHFIETELSQDPQVSRSTLASWLRHRRRQIREKELIFIARHVDVLGQTE